MTPRRWQIEARDIVIPHMLRRGPPGAISVVTGGGESAFAGLMFRALRHYGALPGTTILVTSRTQLVEDLQRVAFQCLDPAASKVWNTPDEGAALRSSEWVGRFDGHYKTAGRVIVTTYPSLPDCLAEHGADLLVCDEAHRSAAAKAEEAILSIPWRFGMSGTLYLTDESRRLRAFDEVLYKYTSADARGDGVIVPVEIVDAGDEETPEGMDRDRSLASMLGMLAQRPDLGPGLVVAETIADARFIAQAMCGQGIRARAVSGEDNRRERRAAVADIISGALDAVVTVDLWGEGVDCPPLRWLGLLAGRRRVQLVQVVGRVVRALDLGRYPAHQKWGPKTCATILDPAGIMRANGLDAEDALGEAPPKDRRKSVATQAAEAVEVLTDRTPWARRVTALERWSLSVLRAVEGYPGLRRKDVRARMPEGTRALPATASEVKALRRLLPVLRWVQGDEALRVAVRELAARDDLPAGVVADLVEALLMVADHRGEMERLRAPMRVWGVKIGDSIGAPLADGGRTE